MGWILAERASGVRWNLSRAPIAAALAIMALSLPAAADESDLVERGIELRIQHRDDEALALFRRAYEATPKPRTRAQIGLAEQALGSWVSAEVDLSAAMAADNDPWIKANAVALDGALAIIRSHLGSLEVRSNVDDKVVAELFVDDNKVGPVPIPKPVRLVLGTHRVEVRAPGYTTSSRTVEVTAGAMLRESFELARETPAPARAKVEPPPKDGRVLAPNPQPGGAQRTLGWTMLGVGVAVGAFALVSFALHDGQVRAYNDDATCPGRSASAQPSQCLDRIDAADRWLTIGIATAVGGGTLALGGLIVALSAPSASKGAATAILCTSRGCGLRF